MDTKTKLAYRVGGLLYTPASDPGIAGHIFRGDWESLTSVCLCLEDSIADTGLEAAEKQLKRTLRELQAPGGRLPMLFVRVRTPEHLAHVHELLGDGENILTGYVLPKFDTGNAEQYMAGIRSVNSGREKTIYGLPILESAGIADLGSRQTELGRLKEIIDADAGLVLMIRVGGNDFCNLFGVRRDVRHTIYDIGVVRDVLTDIVNRFSRDYAVSGPVWEYYERGSSTEWSEGLRRELTLDRLNGFTGKTAIHPSQLPLIFESMKVSRDDYTDACKICGWSDPKLGVAAGAGGRMNEVKCHRSWAERILLRAEIYGIREE